MKFSPSSAFHGSGGAVIQKNLHKMVILEYPIAGVSCQSLYFFSLPAGNVSKSIWWGLTVESMRRVQRFRLKVRPVQNQMHESNGIL